MYPAPAEAPMYPPAEACVDVGGGCDHGSVLAPQCVRSLPHHPSTAPPSPPGGCAIAAGSFGVHTLHGTVYIDLPKSSSTLLRRHALLRASTNDTVPPLRRRPYTFVREPLERFLSGYGTLEARLGAMSEPLPAWTKLRDDVARFEAFVDYFVRISPEQGFADFTHTAAEAAEREKRGKKLTNCLWSHMVPQLWLIRSWGTSTLGFMGRVERLGADLSELDRRWGVVRPNISQLVSGASPLNRNVDEGRDVVNRTQLRTCAPTAIAKVVAHLRNDYECLGYAPPPPPPEVLLPSYCSRPSSKAWHHQHNVRYTRAPLVPAGARPAPSKAALRPAGPMVAGSANSTNTTECVSRTVAGRRACLAARRVTVQ